MKLSPLLSACEHVILDLDGTVWVGGTATPRAPEAVAAICASDRRLVFVTNDGSRSPEEYVQKLWSIGCTASDLGAAAAARPLRGDRARPGNARTLRPVKLSQARPCSP